MIPSTNNAIAALVVFVIPGIAFELLRRFRRPAVQRGPFFEVSVVVLSSAAFTGLAAGLLALIGRRFPEWFPDFGVWIKDPKGYASSHYSLLARTILLELAIALAAALAAHHLINRWSRTDAESKWRRVAYRLLGLSPDDRSHESAVWRQAIAEYRPAKHVAAAAVSVADGTVYSGVIALYTNTEADDERDLALHMPVTVIRGNKSEKMEAENAKYFVLPAREIKSMIVYHKPIHD